MTGRRVRLRGIALPALAGREFTIEQQPNRAVVARGTVAADGTFTATAPVPDTGGRPRFRAVIGKSRLLEHRADTRAADDHDVVGDGHAREGDRERPRARRRPPEDRARTR